MAEADGYLCQVLTLSKIQSVVLWGIVKKIKAIMKYIDISTYAEYPGCINVFISHKLHSTCSSCPLLVSWRQETQDDR